MTEGDIFHPEVQKIIRHFEDRQRAKKSEAMAEEWITGIEAELAKRPNTLVFHQAGSAMLYLVHVPPTLADYHAMIFGADDE